MIANTKQGSMIVKVKADSRIHLGINLQEIRKQKGMTQIEIVRELQLRGFAVEKQNYSRYEKEQEHISAAVLVAVCEILGITLEDAFKENNNKQEVDR